MPGRVQAHRRRGQPHLDVVLAVPGLVVDERRAALGRAGEVALGQRRPLVRALRLGGHQHDRAAVALVAQGVHGLAGGEPATDHHEPVLGHVVPPVQPVLVQPTSVPVSPVRGRIRACRSRSAVCAPSSTPAPTWTPPKPGGPTSWASSRTSTSRSTSGFEVAGYELGLLPDGDPADGALVYWAVDDVAAAMDEAVEAGALGARARPPTSATGSSPGACGRRPARSWVSSATRTSVRRPDRRS